MTLLLREHEESVPADSEVSTRERKRRIERERKVGERGEWNTKKRKNDRQIFGKGREPEGVAMPDLGERKLLDGGHH